MMVMTMLSMINHKLLEDRDCVLLLLVPTKVPAICVAQIQQALVY